MSRRTWAIVAGLGAAAVALALGVTLTRSDDATATAAQAPSPDARAISTDDSGWARWKGVGAQIRDLMTNKQFRREAAKLRDKHQAAMEEWWDAYADNPAAQEAREALRRIRNEARADMENLLREYGVELPGKDVPGRFGGRCRGMDPFDGPGGGPGPMNGLGDGPGPLPGPASRPINHCLPPGA